MLTPARRLDKLLFYGFESFRCTRYLSADSKLRFFINPRVQKILRKLTHVDVEKVFESKRFQKPLQRPTYKLLTDEELETQYRIVRKKTKKLLQMPPILEAAEEMNEILSNDPGLEGFDEQYANYVFTDISPNFTNENRVIVVREPNGVLRKAYLSERKRINQIYFPMEGRHLDMPKMFEPDHLNSLWEREEYKFILDSACINFEPHEPKYIEITRKTYDVINNKFHFSKLHSTRHFGSMTFYLIIQKNIDNMLIDNIKSERISDAYLLVELYHKIHPECESASIEHTSDLENLQNFISKSANKKEDIMLVLQEFLEDSKEVKSANVA